MRASYMLGKSWKIFLGILLSLSLSFAACSKMQGPSEESGKGVVEAPPVDPCEQPENLNNVLCQWVAAEMDMQYAGPGAGQMKMLFEYDPNGEGRPSRITSLDSSGNKASVIDLLYNNFGISIRTTYSNPHTPGHDDFTKIETQTFNYNSDGTLDKIETIDKENGIVQSTTDYSFDYSTPGKVNITEQDKDSLSVVSGGSFQILTKDNNGKIKSMSTKTINSTPQVTSVTIMTLDYDTKSGRLSKMVGTAQDCLKLACIGNNMDKNTATVDPITTPTQVQTIDLTFDDQSRGIKYISSYDGDPSKSPIVPPDGTPDSIQEFDMKYEIQSQANIAYKNPIMNLIEVTGGAVMSGLDLFSVKDLFSSASSSTITGSQSTSSTAMTFKWMRFWQVIPGGQAPGGSNP
jgi:hypothetical protein